MEIGQRIRQLRNKNNLTLEELASRCELTKGFLSQLERNLTSPSISTLEDIVEVLGITMSDFFKEEVEEKIVFTEKDFFVDVKEDHTITWVIPNAQKNDMEPILIEIEPGKTSQLIPPHEGEEFGYVLSGRVRLVQNEDKGVLIKSGQTFYIRGDNEHYLRNEGKSIARVLWVCTPPIF